MTDIVEKLGNSTIHHGRFNDRIFLLKLAEQDCPGIQTELEALAEKNGYSKIIAKIPLDKGPDFIRAGFSCEATIPGFFNAGDTSGSEALFMAKYLDALRSVDEDRERTEAVLDTAAKKQKAGFPSKPPSSCICRPAGRSDASQMAALYKKVFPTYPFPIDDPGFIAETMDRNCRYMGIWHGGRLISLASADMDVTEKNAEMTDFATLKEHRGQQLAGILLHSLENAIASEGIQTCYTIARSCSFGMNITFSRAGYSFAGTLINNTNISGSIESMNVWYKALCPDLRL